MPEHSERSADDYHKLFTALCTNLAREDANTGQRVSWAITLSAGLFAAISFLAPRANDTTSGAYWPAIVWMAITGISLLGLFFSMRSRRGVRAAHEQIEYLRKEYESNAGPFGKLGLPRPFGDPTTTWGLQSSEIFPQTLVIFWSLILTAAVIASIITLSRASIETAPAVPTSQAMAQAKSARR